MIGIVGTGKMGAAIAHGLKKSGFEVIAKDKNKANTVGLKEANSCEELACCEAILLCVKPSDISGVASEMKPAIEKTKNHPLLISIAAGKTLLFLESQFGNERIIRAMPSLAAKVGKSITCYSPNSQASTADLKLAEAIFSSFGKHQQVEESALDAVTAISGSGPAYFFYFSSALSKAGVSAGLPEELSLLLARQTLIGAAAIAEASPFSFAELAGAIATPGGTTEAALGVFEQNGMEKIVNNAVHAAKARGQQIGGTK